MIRNAKHLADAVGRAGETVDVTAELENADTATLWWEPEQGTWADGKGKETNEPGTRPLETPTDKSLYPFDVVIESTSKTGLRENATDERYATVKVTLKDRSRDPIRARFERSSDVRSPPRMPTGNRARSHGQQPEAESTKRVSTSPGKHRAPTP